MKKQIKYQNRNDLNRIYERDIGQISLADVSLMLSQNQSMGSLWQEHPSQVAGILGH